jgi:hypothetical protein
LAIHQILPDGAGVVALATVSPASPALETIAQAIVTLDVQFPWLRGAELHGDSRRQKN